MPRNGPRILLIQVRSHDGARLHEQRCFRFALGPAGAGLDCVDVALGERLTPARLDAAHAILVGGAGDHTATRDYPFSAELEDALLELIEAGRPILGSCYGHHLLARLAGATVVTDREREEIGTFRVELTAAGRGDELFAGVPDAFDTQLGHTDRVVDLPPIVRELAFSESCGVQALRWHGRPVWGTQFHPELDEAGLRERLLMYQQTYLAGGDGVGDLDRRLRPSPHPRRLLANFLESAGLRLGSAR